MRQQELKPKLSLSDYRQFFCIVDVAKAAYEAFEHYYLRNGTFLRQRAQKSSSLILKGCLDLRVTLLIIFVMARDKSFINQLLDDCLRFFCRLGAYGFRKSCMEFCDFAADVRSCL
jgi:hypothetical protein